MGLAGATGPAGDEPEALGDELGAEEAVEQGEPDTGLEGEIELLDGLEDREAAAGTVGKWSRPRRTSKSIAGAVSLKDPLSDEDFHTSHYRTLGSRRRDAGRRWPFARDHCPIASPGVWSTRTLHLWGFGPIVGRNPVI
jgi:hypothetical protein